MAYAETKGCASGANGCTEWAISRVAVLPPSTTERQASRTDDGTVYSPKKYRETEGRKDCTGYTGGGSGKIVFGNVVRDTDCNIVFTPGGASGGPSKRAGETEWHVYGYDPTIDYERYAGAYRYLYDTSNPGSIKFVDKDGNVIRSATAAATANFIAGGGEVKPVYADPVTVLALSGSTRMQNFAFEYEFDEEEE